MVNEELYARLKKGVQAWNEGRLQNQDIYFDFSEADLIGAELSDINLSGANLSGANLYRANLSGANLNQANLSRAYLTEANFTGACLTRAYLTGANLSEADLTGADLSGANFSGVYLSRTKLIGLDLSGLDFTRAYLMGTYLTGANLSDADLSGADIIGADLSGTNLSDADLSGANLSDTNLTGLDLSRANLSDTNLSALNLSRANLSRTNLSRTQAFGTDFTSAKFTGACLEDWSINAATKLNDIDCLYIYRKSDKQERRPSSGEFAPGEFTKLFQKALETVDLIFADGIDWKAFLLSFQELQAEYGEEKLSVQAFEKKSGGAFVVRLEVLPEANKAEIECRIKELYEIKLNALEGMYRKELQAKDEQIIIYKEQSASIMSLAKEMAARPIQNIIDVKATSESNSMSESYQSKYDQRNSNNQFVDTAQTGSNSTFNQYNSSEQKKTLAEAASEIQKLLKQLEETNPTATEPEKVAYVNDETTPSFKRRVVGAFQAGGETAIDEFILENKYLKVAKAAIKGWLQPGG